MEDVNELVVEILDQQQRPRLHWPYWLAAAAFAAGLTAAVLWGWSLSR